MSHADEVPGKAGAALREHLGQVLLNRQLTELVRDVPLDLAPDDLEWQGFSREQVHEVFDDLEFQVLRERLFSTFPDAADEPAAAQHEVTLSDSDASGWLARHAGADLGLVVVGSWGGAPGR